MVQKSVAVALALILMGSGPGNARAASIATAIPSASQLAETTPPQTIQTLRRVLDQYQPQVKILSPKSGEMLQDNTVSLSLQVKDLPIYKDANLGLGPHLHLVVDDQPYRSIYDVTQPIVLTDLAPGTHTVRVFAVRPWDESFKNDGSFAQVTFSIFTKTDDNDPDLRKPLLTYSQPQGSYGAEPIMVDFYLTNAPLHFIAQDDLGDSTRDWKIRATVNGQSFLLDRWQPVYLKGVKPGKNWIQLEFIDENGNRVENLGNNTARIFTYTPNGTSSLSKLIRGELTIAQSKGIVDPTYVPPVPIAEPVMIPAIESVVEPVKSQVKSKTEPKIKLNAETRVTPEALPNVPPKLEPSTKPDVGSKSEPKDAKTIVLPAPEPKAVPTPIAPVIEPALPRLPIVPVPLRVFGKKSIEPTSLPAIPQSETSKPKASTPIDTLPDKPGRSDRHPTQSQYEEEKSPAIPQRSKSFQFFNKKAKAIEPPTPIDRANGPAKPDTANVSPTPPLKVIQPEIVKPEIVKPKAINPKDVRPEAIAREVLKPSVFIPPTTPPAPPTPPKPQLNPTEQKPDTPPRFPFRLSPGKKVDVTIPAKSEPKKIEPKKVEPEVKANVTPKVESKVAPKVELKAKSKVVPRIESKTAPQSIETQSTPQKLRDVTPSSKADEKSEPKPVSNSSNWFDRFRKSQPDSSPTDQPAVTPIAKPIEVPAPAVPKSVPKIELKNIEPNAIPKSIVIDRPKVTANPTQPIRSRIQPTQPTLENPIEPDVKPDVKPSIAPKPDGESLQELVDRLNKTDVKPTPQPVIPKSETPKPEISKPEASKPEIIKSDASKPETPAVE